MDIKESDILGERIGEHWYYKAKARAMLNAVRRARPRVILDIGAGSGFFSRYLLDETDADEAWLVDTGYAEDEDEQYADKRVFLRRSIDKVDADLVLLMDVLEHVDDDLGLLADYAERVPDGARFFITVPAFRFLWSGHDEFLEHKRRYTLEEVEKLASDARLKVLKGAYFFGGILPIAASLRLFSRFGGHEEPKSQLKMHHPLVNGALSAICTAELPFFTLNRLGGLSVVCLAEKLKS